MAKRLTELQKKDIIKSFVNGMEIKEISKIYNYSSQTISKQIKNILGEDEFKNLKLINSRRNKDKKYIIDSNFKEIEVSSKDKNSEVEDLAQTQQKSNENSNPNSFFEVIPLIEGVDLSNQKDITSIPISDIELPEVVYILVDKKIELEPKKLKDFPEWSFMPEEDLERMTLKIYSDQKNAKRTCSKDQKLIKIPDSNVFSIASKHLKAKGISRIIFEDTLLSI